MAAVENPLTAVKTTLEGLAVASEAMAIEGDFPKAVKEVEDAIRAELAEDPIDLTTEGLEGVRERRNQAVEQVYEWLIAVVATDHLLAEFEKAASE